MNGKQRRDSRKKRREERRAKAEREAEDLRAVRRLKQEEGLSWEAAMRRAGLVLPHASLHRKLERLDELGVEGLVDHRRAPPSRLTQEIRGFVTGLAETRPGVRIEEIGERVQERYGESFAKRTLQDVLHEAGVVRSPFRFSSQVQPALLRKQTRDAERKCEEFVPGSGLIWATIGDELTGYTKGLAEEIQKLVAKLPPARPVSEEERELRDEKGRFLPAYNAPRPRRDPKVGACFESVDVKREDKDLGRVSIAKARPETIQRKLRTVMALPVVTDAGRFDAATDFRGCSLAGLGWLDYMPETMAKFSRELKWVGASEVLMRRHAEIWHEQMVATTGQPDVSAGIVYVDAVMKALWTRQFHQSGLVSCNGRVMPCLEKVLIHQGAGVPLYMATFSGHVPLVKHVLPLIAELEEIIGKEMVGRLTVLDGEMDCVALFKQFDLAEPKRYFITPLDAARVKDPAAIRGLRHLVSYRNGDWIGGGWLDLNDSSQPEAPPYRCRVIVLERRTKQTWSVFGTNAPIAEFTDAFLVDTYFSRWPYQELIFRQLNQATAFKAVHGYGKKRVLNISVIDSLTALDAQLERLDARTEKANEALEKAAGKLHREDIEKRRLERNVESARHTQNWLKRAGQAHTKRYAKAQEREQDGRRDLKVQRLQTTQAKRKHATASKKRKTLQAQKLEKLNEQQKLRARTEIYQNDTELDQIVGILKLGFALTLRIVFAQFFHGLKMDINTFVNQVLMLPGLRTRTDATETIQFLAHRRNPEVMKALEEACERFNRLGHHHDGRLLRLEVSWPPGTDPPNHAG